MCIDIRVCIHAYIFVYTCIHFNICMSIHVSMYIHIYIVYMYIDMCMVLGTCGSQASGNLSTERDNEKVWLVRGK